MNPNRRKYHREPIVVYHSEPNSIYPFKLEDARTRTQHALVAEGAVRVTGLMPFDYGEPNGRPLRGVVAWLFTKKVWAA